MKYLKILAFMLGAACITACSDKYPTDNTDVEVGMAKADISYRENQGIIKVPVEVKGDLNHNIVVTCKVAEYTSDPAMENVHYLVTSKSIVIAPEDPEGYFEISLVDDNDPNEPRAFILTLESAQGATIAGITQTVVTIRDNDSFPYDRLGGTWVAKGKNYSGGDASYTMTLEAFDDGELGYGDYYIVGEDLLGFEVQAQFNYNAASETGSLSFTYGDGYTINHQNTECPAIFCYIDGGYIMDSGTITFTWNDDFTELNFVDGPQENGASFFSVFNDSGWYIYNDASQITQWTRP